MVAIDPRILSKAVKAVTPKEEKVEEAQIRGTIVYRNQEHFVQLDGAPSNALTPIANFAEGASDAGFVHGDRVLVLIKNHQAIVTKNLTTGLQAQAAKEASTFTTAITDEGITAQRIIANDTFTNTLRANNITADEIIAGMATIDTLDANYAHITDGVIDNAKIGVADVNDLSANYAHITTGVIDNAKIDAADVNNLSANYAHITNGVIDNAKIGYADVNNLSANYAHITNGVIDNAKIGYADVDDLDANYAHITNGLIDNAKIGYADVDDLDANYARVTNGVIDNATINHADVIDLDVDYVQADLANIDQAIINQEWVDTIMVQSGLISHEGAIFELDAVQVNASSIKAGTIDVERLIVSVPDSQDPTIIRKYMVHIDPTTGTPSYEKIDADVLEDYTITADKIVAEAITATKITTENLVGSGGWINLRNGTFAYADAGENNYLKWNGSKLQIKADEFILSTGQNILDAIEAIGTYFLAGVPTPNNEPAVNWTTDNLKMQHLRDVYYDTDSGKSYRWSYTTEAVLEDDNGNALQDEDGYDLIGQLAEPQYAWIQIEDGDIDQLSERVSVAETKISQNQEAILLKANQTDLELVTGRLSTAETTIAQNSQAIALKAEASSVYSKLEIDGKFHEGLNIRTSFTDTSITLTATVVLAGVDVTDNYMPGDFEWFYRLPKGDVSVNGAGTSTNGKSITIQKSNMAYGQSIICVFTKRAEEPLLDGDDNPLTDENDDALIGYVEVA